MITEPLTLYKLMILYLLKSIQIKHFANGVEYIITLRHLYRRKVSCSFRYTRFCCHNQCFILLYWVQR